MTVPAGGRPSLDAWFAQAEALEDEVKRLHEAGEHTWCDSLQRRRSEQLVRRIAVRLRDLGLDHVLPDNFIRATSDGITFGGNLDRRSTDRFLTALEALATHDGRYR
jgi:hypothetical protein